MVRILFLPLLAIGLGSCLESDIGDGDQGGDQGGVSRGAVHLYFNETFDETSEVIDGWRHECMNDLPHDFELDSPNIIAIVTPDPSGSEPYPHQACGQDAMNNEAAARECCSKNSGAGGVEGADSDGLANTTYSNQFCVGHYRFGYCPAYSDSGTRMFEVWPTDVRRWPPGVGDVKGIKGGAELATRIKNNPQTIEMENGVILKQGWDSLGVEYLSLDANYEGQTNYYGFRLRVNDTSLITSGLAERSYLFQFHSQSETQEHTQGGGYEACDPAGSFDLDEAYTGILDHTPEGGVDISVAPMAGLLLNYEDGELELQFKTKSPNMPYYQFKLKKAVNESPKFVDCDNTNNPNTGKDVCNTTFWRKRFGSGQEGAPEGPTVGHGILQVGEWMTIVVEMKEAGQQDPAGCDLPELRQALCRYVDADDEAQQAIVLEKYEDCRPSTGHLALYINGEQIIGNVKEDPLVLPEDIPDVEALCAGESIDWEDTKRTLPWTYKQSRFEGVTTRFQTCPNYLKIGSYALGYDYEAIAASAGSSLSSTSLPSKNKTKAKKGWQNADDVPKLEVEFDFVRVSNTLECALDDEECPDQWQ
jgi:hypothetical protein